MILGIKLKSNKTLNLSNNYENPFDLPSLSLHIISANNFTCI